MKTLKTTVTGVLIVFLALSSIAANAWGHIPETLEHKGETLVLNGSGARRILFMAPYEAGLYLKYPDNSGFAIAQAEKPMAIRLHMTAPSHRPIMIRSLYNGMRNAVDSLGGNFSVLEDRIETLISYFSDELLQGDIYDFYYIPGEGVHALKNGRNLGTITGSDFKAAFFGIWLNDTASVDKSLKQALLGGEAVITRAEITASVPEEVPDYQADRKNIEQSHVYFNFDSYILTAEAKFVLDAKAAWMHAHPQINIRMEVHADYRGSARYNRKLSENRAKATRDYLQQLGIDPHRIKMKIYGSDNSSETAHQLAEDRRIEFKVEEQQYQQ